MSDTQYGDFKLYRYDPSMAGAVIFIIAFIAVTALHFYQMIRTKTYFFVPFVIGGLFEVIGYIAVSLFLLDTLHIDSYLSYSAPNQVTKLLISASQPTPSRPS
jgi:uncharacterized protein YebE (UPF0316 family)